MAVFSFHWPYKHLRHLYLISFVIPFLEKYTDIERKNKILMQKMAVII